MPKIDLAAIPIQVGSLYPGALAASVGPRSQQRLGPPSGLTQFGANLVTLEPYGMSSLRHWHVHQDEFVMVTNGQLTLIEDDLETELSVGDCAAFPAGVANAHHLVNRSDAAATFLVIGTHTKHEQGYYADVDMQVEINDGTFRFTKRDGSELDDPS